MGVKPVDGMFSASLVLHDQARHIGSLIDSCPKSQPDPHINRSPVCNSSSKARSTSMMPKPLPSTCRNSRWRASRSWRDTMMSLAKRSTASQRRRSPCECSSPIRPVSLLRLVSFGLAEVLPFRPLLHLYSSAQGSAYRTMGQREQPQGLVRCRKAKGLADASHLRTRYFVHLQHRHRLGRCPRRTHQRSIARGVLPGENVQASWLEGYDFYSA